MMREIKFRGKRKDNGEWVEGDLVTLYHLKRLCIAKEGDDQNWSYTQFHEVIPETVGQFTTLRDVNERDIWQGDVAEEGGDKGVVFWNVNGSWCVRTGGGCIYSLNYWKCQVIGNIHENPELLKPKESEADNESN